MPTDSKTAPAKLPTPKRRIQMVINLGADSWKDAAHALEQIVDRIEREGPIESICSGGCSAGYWIETGENAEQTAEHYRSQLIEWREDHKAKKNQGDHHA